MFAETHRSSPLAIGVTTAGGLVAIGGIALIATGGMRRVDILLAGGNPFAAATVDDHRDQIYPVDPLTVVLGIEATLVEVDTEGALALADAIAEDLGLWLLAHTGARDLHEAEALLWERGGPDPLVVAWAMRMQGANVRARREGQRLSADIPETPGEAHPVYVHPDDLPWMFLHAAWHLDLSAELIRSPIHHYVLLRQPDGDGLRAVEPTALWRIDALGDMVTSDEKSVGLFLTMHESQFRRGTGGIRNPDPLPPGIYETIQPDALEGDLIERLSHRHGSAEDSLRERLGDSPAVARALWQRILSRGLAAVEADDTAAIRSALDDLTALLADHPDVGSSPDHQVLAAALAYQRGEDGRALLRDVFSAHEPDGPVTLIRSDAHATAMWLDLEDGRVTAEDWNRRIIPLMNRHRQDPDRFARLCALGRIALANADPSLDEVMPTCVESP